jgi:hypothetical protein
MELQGPIHIAKKGTTIEIFRLIARNQGSLGSFSRAASS